MHTYRLRRRTVDAKRVGHIRQRRVAQARRRGHHPRVGRVQHGKKLTIHILTHAPLPVEERTGQQRYPVWRERVHRPSARLPNDIRFDGAGGDDHRLGRPRVHVQRVDGTSGEGDERDGGAEVGQPEDGVGGERRRPHLPTAGGGLGTELRQVEDIVVGGEGGA